MERFDTLQMADSGNNLILLIKRTSLMIQEISGLDIADKMKDGLNAIDTIHVTKGIFESIISLLLDIADKMKDGLNAHKTFKFLELGKSYTHKKDQIEMFTFIQLATPSQMRRKEQYASVCTGSESHRILNKYKESGLHVRTESEWL
jgi:hypothetical protein